MSIVEDARPSLDPNLIRWGGYGMAAAGVGAAVLAAFRPDMMTTALALVLGLIPVGIGAAWPQLFEVTSRGRRGFNPLMGASAVALLMLAIDVHLVDQRPPWIGAVVVGAGLATATWTAAQRPGLASPIQALILVALIGGVYGYAAYILADTRFDPSPGTTYQSAVTGKSAVRSRSSIYYHLGLSPWGPVAAGSSVRVAKSTYDVLQPGDPICLTLHPGAMGAGWYVVSLCGSSAPA